VKLNEVLFKAQVMLKNFLFLQALSESDTQASVLLE